MMQKDTVHGDPEDITPTQSGVGEIGESKIIQNDAVFGEIQEGDINYRDVGTYFSPTTGRG